MNEFNSVIKESKRKMPVFLTNGGGRVVFCLVCRLEPALVTLVVFGGKCGENCMQIFQEEK